MLDASRENSFLDSSLETREDSSSTSAQGSSRAARSDHPALTPEALDTLRAGLATCRSMRGLTPEANAAIVSLCAGAHHDGWTAEQLLVAVKDACHTSPEIAHLTSTSERDAFLAKIVSACIKEFYREEGAR